MNYMRCLVVVFLFYILAPIDILYAAGKPSNSLVPYKDPSSPERSVRFDNGLLSLGEREPLPVVLGDQQGVEKTRKKKKRKKKNKNGEESGKPQPVGSVVDLDKMPRQRKTLSLVSGLNKNWEAEDLYLDKVSIRIFEIQNLELNRMGEQELFSIQSEVTIGCQNMTLRQGNFETIVALLKSPDVAGHSALSTMRQYSELLRRVGENIKKLEEIQGAVQAQLSAVGKQGRDLQQELGSGCGASNVANSGVAFYQGHLVPMAASNRRSSRSGVSGAPLPVAAQGDDIDNHPLFPGPFSVGGAPLATSYSLVRKVQELLFRDQGKLFPRDVHALIRSEKSCKSCNLQTGKVCKKCQGLKSEKNNFEDKMKQLNEKLNSEIDDLNILIKGGATDEQLLEWKFFVNKLYDAQRESVKFLIKSLRDESFITILDAQQQASLRKLALIDAALACRGSSEGERAERLDGVGSVDLRDLERAFEEVKMFGRASVDDLKDFENRVRKCRNNPDGGLQFMKEELNAQIEHVKSVGNYELLAIKHARSDMVKVFRAEKKYLSRVLSF